MKKKKTDFWEVTMLLYYIPQKKKVAYFFEYLLPHKNFRC